MWKIGTDRMDAAKKNFDEFTWQTRVMPVIVVAIPLFLAAVAKGFTFPSLPETGFMVVIIVAVLSLLYRLGRNLGKKCEAHMVSRLGAILCQNSIITSGLMRCTLCIFRWNL